MSAWRVGCLAINHISCSVQAAGGRSQHGAAQSLSHTGCLGKQRAEVPYLAMRVENEYERGGVVQYLAAWDVHRAVVRLVDDVMDQEPYRSARRVFWIVDNGSSHRGERASAELHERHPRVVMVHKPVHASWHNQVEIYFSIIQRKVLTPNDCASLDELIERIIAVGKRYSALGRPFAWRFTRQDLKRRLRDPLLQTKLVAPLAEVA